MNPFPAELSTKQMCSLLGISQQHLGRLEKDGTVKKLGKDRFATSSIAAVFEHMRRRGAGPDAWNEARTKKMVEQARALEAARLIREGQFAPVSDFADALTKILLAARSRLLAIPNKLGSQIHGRVDEARVAEIVAFTKRMVYDALSELANTKAEGGKLVRRRRTEVA